jgi:hypothetical protein
VRARPRVWSEFQLAQVIERQRKLAAWPTGLHPLHVLPLPATELAAPVDEHQ